jgi:hypothetical protein
MLIPSVLMLCSLQSPAVADIRQARQAMLDLHPGVFRYTTRESFDEAWLAAEAEAALAKDELEMLGALFKAVSSAKCGHTGVVLQGKSLEIARETPMLPLQLLVRTSGFEVVKGFGEASGLKGARVEGINGVSASELVQKLIRMAPKDGDSVGGARFALQNHRPSLYLHLLGIRAPFAVKLSDGREVRLQGVPLRDMLGQYSMLPLNAQSGFSIVGDVGVMRLIDFVSGPGGTGLAQFYDEVVRRLEQERI